MNIPKDKYSNEVNGTCSWCNVKAAWFTHQTLLNAKETDYVVCRETCQQHKVHLQFWSLQIELARNMQLV